MRTELVVFGRRYVVASRARRRNIVIVFYAVFFVLLVANWFLGDSGGGWFTIEFTLLIGPIFGGYFSFGLFNPTGIVEPFAGTGNDERALSRRDRAHFIAYRYLGVVAGAAFLVEYFRYSFLLRYFHAVGLEPGHLGKITYDLLQIAYILFMTLPAAILLWTEPDMEPTD